MVGEFADETLPMKRYVVRQKKGTRTNFLLCEPIPIQQSLFCGFKFGLKPALTVGVLVSVLSYGLDLPMETFGSM